MFKFIIGIIIGVILVKYNILPEMLDFFVQSGAVDKSIETLEDLKKEVDELKDLIKDLVKKEDK